MKQSRLEQFLEGRFDNLTTTQLVDLHDTLLNIQQGVRQATLRLRVVAGSRSFSESHLRRSIRALNSANESIKLLGGAKAVRKRLQEIRKELLARVTST